RHERSAHEGWIFEPPHGEEHSKKEDSDTLSEPPYIEGERARVIFRGPHTIPVERPFEPRTLVLVPQTRESFEATFGREPSTSDLEQVRRYGAAFIDAGHESTMVFATGGVEQFRSAIASLVLNGGGPLVVIGHSINGSGMRELVLPDGSKVSLTD